MKRTPIAAFQSLWKKRYIESGRDSWHRIAEVRVRDNLYRRLINGRRPSQVSPERPNSGLSDLPTNPFSIRASLSPRTPCPCQPQNVRPPSDRLKSTIQDSVLPMHGGGKMRQLYPRSSSRPLVSYDHPRASPNALPLKYQKGRINRRRTDKAPRQHTFRCNPQLSSHPDSRG